jgi:hypothetical protein
MVGALQVTAVCQPSGFEKNVYVCYENPILIQNCITIYYVPDKQNYCIITETLVLF